MASADDLRASGLLYGSNYKQWKVRVDAKLRVHGLDRFVIQSQPSEEDGYSGAEWWAGMSEKAANIIRIEVAPDTLSRISEEELHDAHRLMNRLEAMTVQFRFLDLPAELRNRVYACLIDSEGYQVVKPRLYTETRHPTITKASKQLREESLTSMYKRTTFCFDFTGAVKPKETFSVSAAIQRWSERQPRSQLKFLRDVVVKNELYATSRWSCVSWVSHSFSEAGGLQCSTGSALDAHSNTLLGKHIQKHQDLCDLLSLEGETILLTLLADPGLWMKLIVG